MNWNLIKKDKAKQPSVGEYNDWKELIAAECFNQCVYCCIHEQQFGGINNYHIDHFRPKSKFKNLENDILNLFYSCPICNRFKSDDWPAEPDDLNLICYPNPSEVNYSDLFELEDTNGLLLIGKYTSSKYLIERLFLNRAQLLYERREYFLGLKQKQLLEEIRALESNVTSEHFDLISYGNKVRDNLLNVLQRRRNVRPYKRSDIQKA